MESVGFYLLAAHGQRRHELPEQAVDGLHGNLPNAEEPQHMIDAVGIEELRHILKATHPPCTVVLEHLIPVVSGESPVLSIHAEVVGRCSGLPVEIKVFGLGPYITTVAVYPDGDVALEDDTLRLGILMHALHLGVENELDEIEERDLPICLRARIGELLAVALVPHAMVFPSVEIGRSILIAQGAILCIRHQPALRFGKECLEFGTPHHLPPFLLLEEDTQIGELGLVHPLIVYLRQGIQFLAFRGEFCPQLLVLEPGKLVEVYKLRVQREDADAAIGIAVGPSVGGRRVVDRQDLQHPLMGGCHEVYHHAEVAEVADTEAPLRTEREHRYQRSGQLLIGEREEGLREVVTHQLALVHPRQVDGR